MPGRLCPVVYRRKVLEVDHAPDRIKSQKLYTALLPVEILAVAENGLHISAVLPAAFVRPDIKTRVMAAQDQLRVFGWLQHK